MRRAGTRASGLLLTILAGCGHAQPAERTDRVSLDLEAMMAVAERAAGRAQLPAGFAVPGLEPTVVLWSLLRDEAGGAVAEAARGKLAQAHAATAVEPGAARLLVDGQGAATMSDGTRVDWAPGAPDAPPRAEAEVELAGGGAIVAGQPLQVKVRVRNAGKGPLYQLRALARTDATGSAGALVLFGRVEAGATLERLVALDTQETLSETDAQLALEFTERNGYAPPAAAARVAVRTAPRPKLELGFRTFDDGSGTSVGNGDGILQRGETLDLLVTVQNVGSAPAIGTNLVVHLDETPELAVFGGMIQPLGDLPPGAKKEGRVGVSVKPGYSGSAVLMALSAHERSAFTAEVSHALTLHLDARAPQQMVLVDRLVVALGDSPLLSEAAAGARALGRVDRGSRLRAVGELGDFVQVEYADASGTPRRGWLAASSLGSDEAAAPPAPGTVQGPGTAVVRELVNTPPIVVLLTPAEGSSAATAEDTVSIKATAKDAEGLASVEVLVRGQVVPEAGLRGVRPQAGAGPGDKLVNVDVRVGLLPGPNPITVRARDSDGEVREASAVVLRAVREPAVVALVVGLDQYEDPELTPLRYAEADARAMADFLRGPRSPVKNPDDVVLLVGKDASVTNIRVWIDRQLVNRATQPEDMAILYFAGHGFSQGERYVLAGRDTRAASLRATGLRETELQEFWRDIRAERKLFIADACHAGGLRGMRGDNAIAKGLLDATRDPSRARGRVTILAARDQQQSVELDQRGHGAFTTALLEGLGGRADVEAGDRDGRVSVRELVGFLDREVPALARSVGHDQNPVFEVADAEGDLVLTR